MTPNPDGAEAGLSRRLGLGIEELALSSQAPGVAAE
jgi:hypothetical protein